MKPGTIYYHFHPDSIGWLHRRHKRGDEILAKDLDRLLSVDPANGSDPILIHYLREHLNGRLKPRRGRKSLMEARATRLMLAEFLISERSEEIKAERKAIDRNLLRAELDPSVQAADEIGRWLHLPVGRTLLNLISAWKRELNNRSAKAATA